MSTELPTSPEGLKQAFARFPTGVAVVCARDTDGTDGGMTANAICSLSLDPLLVLICFENEARTLPLVERSGRFSISILAESGSDLADRFASKLDEGEKLKGIGVREELGVPVLEDAIAWAVCSLKETLPGGDHRIVIGEVEALGSAEGRPLVWYGGTYGSLSDAERSTS